MASEFGWTPGPWTFVDLGVDYTLSGVSKEDIERLRTEYDAREWPYRVECAGESEVIVR